MRTKRPTPPQEPRQRHNERPTPERMAHGLWRLGETIEAGVRVAMDDASHPLDAMLGHKLISRDQHQAGYDFEALYRAQCEVAQSRDSTTIWEPRGHDETDGPIAERRRYRDLCRAIGMIHDSCLIRVCVHRLVPRGKTEMGEFREALNAAVHFFTPGGKRRLHPF